MVPGAIFGWTTPCRTASLVSLTSSSADVLVNVVSKSRTRLALLIVLITALGGCSGSEAEPSPPPESENDLTHEELQSEDYGPVITYGNVIPSDGPLHDVVVDGKKRKSIFAQANLDFAEITSVTREEYETAFLNFAACIEDRGGWIHYHLPSERINYTMTASSDPQDYCYLSHFYFVDGTWQRSIIEDESERIQFYIDCLNNNDVEPVHLEPAEERGQPQWDQSRDLQVQAKEAGIDCGSFVDSFFEDAPYPED